MLGLRIGSGLAVLICACGQGGVEVDDSGRGDAVAPVDATVKMDASVGMDANADTSVDASTDAVNDAGPDAIMDASTDAGPTERIVFVSSVLYDGNLGGLAGADSKCQGLAIGAGLPGTYKAWLSDSATSAFVRLTHSAVPYVLVDKTVIANDWTQLTSGSLLSKINLTEKGQTPPAGTYTCGNTNQTVWSNTLKTGGIFSMVNNCSGWTSNAPSTAHVGSFNYKTFNWTDFCVFPVPDGGTGGCEKTSALYCFQQ
jgi:hypothetical protein